ncbi:beta-propeller domain-containing protein, partial [Candidatus Bathyarchaeota archaeon]|nr:beta-propeller domain-containing protein [Candidatus Bathyarchaeota archaeon]
MDKTVTNMMLAVFLVVTIVTLPNIVASVIKPSFLEPTNQIKTFFSQEELTGFVLAGLRRAEENRLIEPFSPQIFKGEITAPTVASSRDLTEYSTTNVQVAGVDEADIVKSDGKFVYLASRNRFVIVEAYPAEGMKVLSSTTIKGSILGL